MITLDLSKNYIVSSKIIQRYKNSIPALIIAYIRHKGDGFVVCTVEDIRKDLQLSDSAQKEWIKKLIKDGFLERKNAEIHNKRFLKVL